MLSRFLLIVFSLLVFASCNFKQHDSHVDELKVEDLLRVAEQNIEKELTISGRINHVCSHSGRRCFIVDSTGEFSIRIEAAGEIENFGKELMGNLIKVTGILKENRLMASEIDEMANDVIAEHPSDAEPNGEHCSAEMTNINKMRSWMKEHGKNYYSIFYIEGIRYELAE
ncbi:MAG TPA: hypothetical protein VJY41_07925 [Prolixibacteraceae bacterium]|nr:hypothetical protein [Prolixibacteraceae bacterium]